MDKHYIMSALGVGLGVGVGIGLASGQTVSRWAGSFSSSGVTAEVIEQELRRLVIDGKEEDINFDGFPYYLR